MQLNITKLRNFFIAAARSVCIYLIIRLGTCFQLIPLYSSLFLSRCIRQQQLLLNVLVITAVIIDYRVVSKGDRSFNLNVSINMSKVWKHIKLKLKLKLFLSRIFDSQKFNNSIIVDHVFTCYLLQCIVKLAVKPMGIYIYNDIFNFVVSLYSMIS